MSERSALTARDTDRVGLFAVVYGVTKELGIDKGTTNLFKSAATLRQFFRRHRRKPAAQRLIRAITRE